MAPELATLMYHEVTDDPTTSGFQRPAAMPFKLRRRSFSQHLDAIAAAGGAPVSAVDIDFARPGRHLLLTFDDGGASALQVGEALAARGWKAHFFITTAKLGTRTFLDAAGVRALHQAGHVIGTHSHSHPNVFRALPPPAMLAEWCRSRARLEEILGAPVITASVPGGDSSPSVERSAALAGLRLLFTSEPTLVPTRSWRSWIIGRACVKTTTSLDAVRALASFHGWRREWMIWRLKDAARTALDPAYRHWVRTREIENL
ncbi:MAG TPA: polysaccharide deacetylase family protein [Polyangia bacterium]|nr:polysaccharide deacetylase family protein [Polyangia bacterium]